MADRHNTREYRIWRNNVVVRDGGCLVCKTKKSLHAHHLHDFSYHKELRYVVENGATLCEEHHTMFHCDYMDSFRQKTTKKDFDEFMKIVKSLKATFENTQGVSSDT